jgi:hypothetical protein
MSGPLCKACGGSGALWSRSIGTWEPCGCEDREHDEDDFEDSEAYADDDGQPDEAQEWADYDPDC